MKWLPQPGHGKLHVQVVLRAPPLDAAVMSFALCVAIPMADPRAIAQKTSPSVLPDSLSTHVLVPLWEPW